MKNFIFLLAFIELVFGHEDGEFTLQYNEETFPIEVPKKNHFVMFYAPWCGHCQRLSPTWEQLAEMLHEDEDSRVRIAKVDCTTDNAICSEHDVTGYPTLKFFKVGEKKGSRFRGTRDLPSLTAFINEQLGSVPKEEELDPSSPEAINGLIELTEDTFDDHVVKGQHFIKFYAPWCGHCQKLAPTWDELANSFRHDNSVSIAKVDCTQHRSVCGQFDIKGYPTLLWIEDGKKVDKYTGERGHEQLKSYVSMMLGKSEDKTTDKKDDTDDDTIHSVMTLTGDNFEHGVEKGISFIKFFAPWCGHCKRMAPTWEELGKKFLSNENVNIVKVDCTMDASKKLCSDQEVDGFPTLFLYRDGQKVTEYNGSRRLDDLYEFVMKHIQSHDEL
ncbi:thioredoxin domain-containing protein 5 homolog [Orussus abietinus]|uniref:thioredoxin domain-containing protein 5 homolog n=1 Tax=Orussus abietinus TaxID=222816 RepID=UPI0006268F35|nr:thioredoxin domain-containing protein 5 homolog [Orussus abietinus]XP_012286500.1 thioredoxin domain-containing protein 5 homolog [Orussus abietinus]